MFFALKYTILTLPLQIYSFILLIFEREYSPISNLNVLKMKVKRIIFGLLACVTLMAVSCEPNSTADEDELYEVGVDKTKIPSQAGD
jgi:hypothetical protein